MVNVNNTTECGKIEAVAITGVTGMIGSTLAKLFSSQDIKVYGFARETSGKLRNLCGSCESEDCIEIIYGSLEEYGSRLKDYVIERNIKADVFFHFAWLSPFGSGRNDTVLQNSNVGYALDAVQLANAMGCHTFVGAGSQAEYGRVEGLLSAATPTRPENAYGVAKLAAGKLTQIMCEQFGMRHIWSRILSVYGPGDNDYTMVMSAINEMLDGKRKAFTPGEQLWDFLYSEDCARAFKCIAEKGVHGKIYCIGSGIGRPLKEYITIMRDMINPALELGLGDVPYAENQVMQLCADISELTADTGFEPTVDFRDGIQKTIEWIKNKKEG